MDTGHLDSTLVELKHDLKDIRKAVLGDVGQPGLVELVRDHERRLAAIEQLGRKVSTSVLERILQAATAGTVGWLAAHFGGTRP